MTLLERAHEEGAAGRLGAVGEPPLMLLFSVREALRQAAAAFGPEGTSVDLIAGYGRGGVVGAHRGGEGP